MSFSELPISARLISSLPEKIKTAKEIQIRTIPVMMDNRDLLALAQTGSGKTLAYGLPLIEKAMQHRAADQAIVLVPTRELATQISNELSSISQQIDVQVMTLCGGTEIDHQITVLTNNPAIIVATPGRLLELLKQNMINVQRVKSLVLDEVDRLLDMGFWPDLTNIISYLPAINQTALFSATMPEILQEKANSLLSNPVQIQLHAINSVVDQIQEHLYLVNKGNKAKVLIHQIKQHQWQQVLVFISTRENADALSKKLNKSGISCAALHGNKSQQQRNETLDLFKQHKLMVVIATDLLARGLHIERLPVVVNYDLPANPETYVHRIGRTARMGAEGLAVSLVCHNENQHLDSIRQFTNRELKLDQLEQFPVTDKPSYGESARRPRDKQANRRTNNKKSIKAFKTNKHR
ncbi:DEAD/DEAH box helicase [Vibrio sp. TH_r3]|uniref:DEAD/DEAH box helicase n=1 Tax=Vibrio sp. TH_r3 TaxID=3082084 RepID=UPI002955AA54|nr:DEAD/DEAH box helicase [Vibrio sp. TH_r3]MDV7104965.1 DEAD/DEAH box helicase [Vibrio sp. TH_r3]